MTPENDKKLCDKYPKIFADRGKSMKESCMYWGLAVGDGWYDLIDQACAVIQNHIDWSAKYRQINEDHNALVTATRAGDMTLFDKHYAKSEPEWKESHLQRLLHVGPDEGKDYGSGIRELKPLIPQLVADQVKEKFGGLRFYHHGGDEFCDGVLQMADAMSFRICEDCGAPGKVGGRGWIRTLCNTHRAPEEKLEVDLENEDDDIPEDCLVLMPNDAQGIVDEKYLAKYFEVGAEQFKKWASEQGKTNE